MARASKNGLRLAKSWGDSSRYDVVVETGRRFVRVQVKSTANRQPNGDTFTASIRAQTTNSTSGEALISWQLA
jgi:hypothetical protein